MGLFKMLNGGIVFRHYQILNGPNSIFMIMLDVSYNLTYNNNYYYSLLVIFIINNLRSEDTCQ